VDLSPDLMVIGEGAFAYCRELKKVKVPLNVVWFGTSAFDHCHNLTSVTFGQRVSGLDDSVFLWCTSMAKVDLSATCCHVINNYAFTKHSDLCYYLLPLNASESMLSGERMWLS
jgi:hypothetical protein